jgi:phenylpropionate dioxygenase-like ring-hydroxylating dioxygenase large terminal subunit
MLTKETNELLTRTGPGTPMGELMRRYWMPAALSSELPGPDCPPIRVKLLGENLVAFRDSDGKIGLVEEFCAHRGASLFLGRNEDCGLRCVYHGWKYDVDGRCVDMPNAPDDPEFKNQIRLQAYPTLELADVIWAYLGQPDKVPPPPAFEWTGVSQESRCVSKTWQECNWLQALEGGIDTTHGAFLHRAISKDTNKPGINPGDIRVRHLVPEQEIELTDYGFVYASIRSLGEQGTFFRTYHYALPIYQFWAIVNDSRSSASNMWVPMDDENCMVFSLMYRYSGGPFTAEEKLDFDRRNGRDRLGADFKKLRNKDNDWMIDRQAQKRETFTGIQGINLQDHAVQESMGPIVDRSREHLVASDKAIVTARHLLMNAVKKLEQKGDPPNIWPSCKRIRAIHKTIPAGVSWRDALQDDES